MLNVLFHMVLHHTSDLRCCMVLIVAGSYRSLSLIEFYSTKMTMYQPFHTTCTNTIGTEGSEPVWNSELPLPLPEGRGSNKTLTEVPSSSSTISE